MTRDDTIRIFGIVVAAYPAHDKFLDEKHIKMAVDVWADVFIDDDPRQVAMAVKAHICTSKWPPSIAEIRERMASLSSQDTLSEMEAWALVRKAISGGRCALTERFSRLPRTVQRAVGSPSQLREWGFSDIDSMPVIQSNFLRTYRAVVKQEAERAAIPESMRKMIAASTIGLLNESRQAGEAI